MALDFEILNNPIITEKVRNNVSGYVIKKFPGFFSREDVEDLVQDAWAKLLGGKNGYRCELSQPQTILTTIAVRLAINMYVKRKMSRDVLFSSVEYNCAMDGRESVSPHSILESKEGCRRIESFISAMDESTQSLVYGVADGRSYQELGVELGRQPGALATRMCRARCELQRKLDSAVA